ncbi:MAG: ammonium transporter, partial [Proteobacteria bacterium]|nr:ammonium transporter [Pseudomonadota bacterium]
YDDSLDAFGVHGVGGIIGAVLTGVFAREAISPIDAHGLIEGNGAQVITQLYGIGVTVVYCAIATAIILKVVDLIVGLRVEKDEEREGLDIVLHGEVVN